MEMKSPTVMKSALADEICQPDEVGFHRVAISSIFDGFILPKADFIDVHLSSSKR